MKVWAWRIASVLIFAGVFIGLTMIYGLRFSWIWGW